MRKHFEIVRWSWKTVLMTPFPEEAVWNNWATLRLVIEGSLGDRIIHETLEAGVSEKWLDSWPHCLYSSWASLWHSHIGRNHCKGKSKVELCSHIFQMASHGCRWIVTVSQRPSVVIATLENVSSSVSVGHSEPTTQAKKNQRSCERKKKKRTCWSPRNVQIFLLEGPKAFCKVKITSAPRKRPTATAWVLASLPEIPCAHWNLQQPINIWGEAAPSIKIPMNDTWNNEKDHVGEMKQTLDYQAKARHGCLLLILRNHAAIQ